MRRLPTRVSRLLVLTAVALGIGTAPAHAEFGFVTSWEVADTDAIVGGLATDTANNVYVAAGNVQKFTADGDLIATWGSAGTGDGPVATHFVASDVAIGSAGDVYVSDRRGVRVYRFTADGSFIDRWGSSGTANGQFGFGPNAIATDVTGNLYVSDPGNERIQKFDQDGDFITAWSAGSSVATDVATDSAGNVYVANLATADPVHPIGKFTGDGVLIDAWGGAGRGPGEFLTPSRLSVATDSADHVYVTESHLPVGPRDSEQFARLQKFASDGTFLSEFGCHGAGVENFLDPEGVATDAAGDVYVGDLRTIHKLGDPGTPADCSLVVDVEAKHRQKLKRLRVSASCPEEWCQLTTEGRARAARNGKLKGARLRADSVVLDAGEEATIPLRFLDQQHRRKIRRALNKGPLKRAKVSVALRGEDAHGIADEQTITFRLKR